MQREAAAGMVKAGINQYLDNTSTNSVRVALEKNLLTEADVDKNIKGTLARFHPARPA